MFWGGEGGEEGATKLSQNLTKVSPKFWQNFMSLKFKKNHNTNLYKYFLFLDLK